MHSRLKKYTGVKVHNFGDGLVGYGFIVGISVDDVVQIYIVQLTTNPWKDIHEYDVITVPMGCLEVI